MFKSSKRRFIERLNGLIDEEINLLESLSFLLGDENTIGVDEEMKGDVVIFKRQIKMYQDFKGMISKASMGSKTNDTTKVMNLNEKKIFIQLVKLIASIRKLFGKTAK